MPVVRDANQKPVEQISAETDLLIKKAHSGELSSDEMSGGTFTVSNLGSYGIDVFTPIINPPQCAILGVGRFAQRPVVIEDEILVRWTTVLSLTFDHRIVDGGPASRYLSSLRDSAESPESKLAR